MTSLPLHITRGLPKLVAASEFLASAPEASRMTQLEPT
jgi:hypothetical protein